MMMKYFRCVRLVLVVVVVVVVVDDDISFDCLRTQSI